MVNKDKNYMFQFIDKVFNEEVNTPFEAVAKAIKVLFIFMVGIVFFVSFTAGLLVLFFDVLGINALISIALSLVGVVFFCFLISTMCEYHQNKKKRVDKVRVFDRV